MYTFRRRQTPVVAHSLASVMHVDGDHIRLEGCIPGRLLMRSAQLGPGQTIVRDAGADRATVHRTFIGSVERAETNISIDNIARISDALGVDPADLMKSS